MDILHRRRRDEYFTVSVRFMDGSMQLNVFAYDRTNYFPSPP